MCGMNGCSSRRDRGKNEIHDGERRFLARFVLAEDFRLGRFDEPIAIIAPEKIVEPLRDLVELIFAISGLDRANRFIEARQNFDRIDRQRVIVDLRRGLARTMHLPKTRGVPKLGREIAAFLDLLFVEANVLPARRNPHQTEAQTVRAIFLDQVERIGRIA